MGIGVPVSQIYLYERFQSQLDEVQLRAASARPGLQIVAAERANRYTDNSGYDPATYLEANLFGEEDTRSSMMRLVSQRLTKIINIPNMKDHGATGVTGCLKNIAYGSFSNVARTHQRGKSHTYSVVGTLAGIEPLRSRTVLQIMDGLRAVWHGGPFARTTRYVFYPRQILFGTDPVAIDRLLLDIIEDKRRAEGVLSVWDRSPASLRDGRHARARRGSERQHHHQRAGAHRVRVDARARRLRPREDRGAGHHRMTPLLLAAWRRGPCVYWTQGIESRPALEAAGVKRLCVAPEQVDAWRAAGFSVSPIAAADLAARVALPVPGITARGGPGLPDSQPVDGRERLAIRTTAQGQVRLRPARREKRRSLLPRPSRMARTRS